MEKSELVPRRYRLTFIIVTSLFALWGFANDITNPMVAVFQTVMELSAAKASMVQFAFYGGYATMAIPAALFIRRYSHKAGIMLGLTLYAIGAFLFIPAAQHQQFAFFCLSLYILTFGLAFLETTANPYILSLGDRANATRRLNLAQAFNPVGSLTGMAVASFVVLPQLWSDRRDAAGQTIFASLAEAEKAGIRIHDLAVIRDAYVALGIVVVAVLAVVAICIKGQGKADTQNEAIHKEHDGTTKGATAIRPTLARLWHNRQYRYGVMTQVAYVAAQIMVWTFIIHYADRLGINKAVAQMFNIAAMSLNLVGRFAGTFLMRFTDARRLLTIFGLGAAACTTATILCDGMAGLYALVAISLFMSIMFPTIYGIALSDITEEDTSLGAAFLVMAIVGGALLPPLQGMIIDLGSVMGWPAVNVSFALPLACFIIVTAYGRYAIAHK